MKNKKHESYGMISISRYTGGNCQFFDSDLLHNGGIELTISTARINNSLSHKFISNEEQVVKVQMSNSQFIDAITSGMNTSGVPCTIKSVLGKRTEIIDYVEDQKDEFKAKMEDVNSEYLKRIDNMLTMLEGNVGKRKATEIKHELSVLRTHLKSNTEYVMTCFDEEMDKSITEAKHSISNYIDHKVHSLGIESIRKELNVSMDNKELK